METYLPLGVRSRVAYLSLAAALALVALIPPSAWAQSALSTIHGTVKDESGAAMPGVTVTLTSPALQVGKIVTVSEASKYRLEYTSFDAMTDCLDVEGAIVTCVTVMNGVNPNFSFDQYRKSSAPASGLSGNA